MIPGTMPQCDSSEMYTRAVWPKPSPADLLPDSTAGVTEVSRFSCMKFLIWSELSIPLFCNVGFEVGLHGCLPFKGRAGSDRGSFCDG